MGIILQDGGKDQETMGAPLLAADGAALRCDGEVKATA